ncbi:hypothetical protein ACVMB3_006724 [Sinorhizobium meliloti]
MRVVEMADQVGADDLFMRFDRRFLEAADGADADIAEPDVYLAEAHRLPGQVLDRIGIRHVGRGDENLRPEFPAGSGHLVKRGRIAGRQHELRPAPGKGLGGRLSNPRRGPGDDDHCIFERIQHTAPPSAVGNRIASIAPAACGTASYRRCSGAGRLTLRLAGVRNLAAMRIL